MPTNRSVAFHTLGCKLNFSETSSISRLLEQEGYEKKRFDEVADVYVINTCSVTENADKECHQLVRRIQRKAPLGIIVIMGCYAQLKPETIARIPGVDLVLGAAEKFNLPTHIKDFVKGDPTKICSCDIDEVKEFNPSLSISDRTRSFLKVQDGCDYNCSFCTIPMARGMSRSDSIQNVVANAMHLANNGVKEIVLTGVNLGDFGKRSAGYNDKENFLMLITELERKIPIERFRISSIEPNLLSEDIIEFVARSKKFMPHFHIPLQSGSNKILGLMQRRYKRELYAERVKLIKRLIPHCAVGVDVITGFPGESNDDFNETVDFLISLDVSYLHVFTYSERANTKAVTFQSVVPVPVRHSRNKILRNISFRKLNSFSEAHRGQTRKVLFEGRGTNNIMEGYTDNYIKVNTPFRHDWVNQCIDWELR